MIAALRLHCPAKTLKVVIHFQINKMKTIIRLIVLLLISWPACAQTGWKVCNAPVFANRVDDLFMLDTQTGYAASGDGKIVKTTDGGNNWVTLAQDPTVYCRSVEFINTKKGFVGGFPVGGNNGTNIFRRTTDGGATWTDLTPLLNPKARFGICGLAAADSNTIYGSGNWYQDAAYIVKSVDGGNTWSFIDMSQYAASIIDMYFLNKDTGFATGRGKLPQQSGVILYTTDGGVTWTYKFQNNVNYEFCWKIQRLTSKIYFASLEDFGSVLPHILKSTDGGMTWALHQVAPNPYNIEGIGFIDSLNGWTGGDYGYSFKTTDGGNTWDTIHTLSPYMDRFFKVNDTTMFATGDRIWKYRGDGFIPAIPATRYAWMNCHPNPVRDNLDIDISVSVNTHIMLTVLDNNGSRVSVIDNTDKLKGSYQYHLNTSNLAPGMYYVILKTHEDKQVAKIIVDR